VPPAQWSKIEAKRGENRRFARSGSEASSQDCPVTMAEDEWDRQCRQMRPLCWLRRLDGNPRPTPETADHIYFCLFFRRSMLHPAPPAESLAAIAWRGVCCGAIVARALAVSAR